MKGTMKSLIKAIVRKLARRTGVIQDTFYRPITFDYILSKLPPDPVILEAGAHDGTNTADLASIPGSRVLAFEPVPDAFRRLEERTRAFPNVFRHPIALGRFDGDVEMFVSSGKNDASSSLLEPKDIRIMNPDIEFREKIAVKVATIDSWAETNGVGKIDFLWLDMQGYELAAMQSAPRIMETVSVIYTEVNLLEVYEGVPLYNDVWKWLTSQGFHVDRIDFVWPDQGEVLFVRNRRETP
jgi:FkbM family methyltransferase